MKKKTLKLSKENYSSDEMERYLGALSERQDKKLDTLVEGFQMLNRKIDQHTKEFVELHKTLSNHTEMIGHLMVDTSELKDDMQIVKGRLKKTVDYDEFLSLIKRVQKIEAKM